MSVINQMLKDLEQRTPEQGQVAMPVAISNKPSTIKIVLISLIVLVSLNLLGFYIWNLQQQVTASELKFKEQEQEQEQKQKPIANASRDLSRQFAEKKVINQGVLDQQTLAQDEPIPEQILLTKPADLTRELAKKSMVKEKANLSELPSEKIIEIKPLVQRESIKPNIVSPVLVSPALVKIKLVKTKLVNPPIESKMSVSRRQLTSEELVAKKIVEAEKAIKVNDIIKAEQLFEEVLIVEPNHKQARKNLAALWFGRKLYQQATNLLSQGISLDRSDAELRLLKARIHLQQGQHKAAYNTLKPLSLVKQQEYQVMLANVSQQIEQYKSAIQAYKILIDMQGYSGRWHLGLAIVYDKNSQFSLAITEYARALTKSDLSVASAEFAQQRMQALGE